MKIGLSVFDDNFIAFSINKETKYGYTPVTSLLGSPQECVLVECDPEAPARDNCERTCFSESELSLCRCRCGVCRDKYCDCESPVPAEGFYEDYIANSSAYNFGQVDRVCNAPDPATLLALDDGSPPTPEECNCQKCPEEGKPAPDPNADPLKCCADELETKGPCVCKKEDGCTVPKISGATGETESVAYNETVGYRWSPDNLCYKCACPGNTEQGQPKKFYRCPEEGEEGCQETPEPRDTYGTKGECDQKVESGECDKKYVGVWNAHANGGVGGYDCVAKPNNFPWVGQFQEYNTPKGCQDAIAEKNGEGVGCFAFSTPGSTVHTGLGHCDSKWKCDASRAISPGDPWKCRQTPFISGSDLYDTEQECKKRCCNGEYAESVGSCLKDDRCVPSLRAGCPEGDYFSCSECNPEAFGGCPEDTEPCNPNSHREYVFETSFFGNVTITHCYCSPDP